MNAGTLVGRKGTAKQQVSSDVLGGWKTDIIRNRDPNFEYHFFTEDQVRERLYPTQIGLKDFESGEWVVHDIPAWTLVQRETGPEVAAGFRPDEGKPIDTALRHGKFICMKIPREAWDIMQKQSTQRADGYDVLCNNGTSKDFAPDGTEGPARSKKPHIRVTEQPLQRI
jgi:hypothetical protein